MNRYLTHYMLRQLLTLLALISGLGLATTPGVAAHASVVSVAAAGDVEDCKTIATQPLQFARGFVSERQVPAPCRRKPVVVWTPTVQLQADRARE